jgi:hypothetical protein
MPEEDSMICPCGGRLQKRISDEGRAFECVSCGRYELKALVENHDFSKFDYSLPVRVFPPQIKPFEDIGQYMLNCPAIDQAEDV